MIDTDDGLHGLGREIIRPGRLRESHRLGEWRSGRRGRAVAPVSVCECVRVALSQTPDVSHGSQTCHTELAVSHRARRGTRSWPWHSRAIVCGRWPEGGDKQRWQEQRARHGTGRTRV